MKVIVVKFVNVFIKSKPWLEAHIKWFEHMAYKINRADIIEWLHKDNYFDMVLEIMSIVAPKESEKRRIEMARNMYFNSLIVNMPEAENVVYFDAVEMCKYLKQDYKVVLISSQPKKIIDYLIDKFEIRYAFSEVYGSEMSDVDDWDMVYNRFLKKQGKNAYKIFKTRLDLERFYLNR